MFNTRTKYSRQFNMSVTKLY